MTNLEAKNAEGLLEATATLKGMLGIGSATRTGGDKQQNGGDSPSNKQVTKVAGTKTKSDDKQKKKKKNKKNTGEKAKGGGKQSKQSGKNKNANSKQTEKQAGQNEKSASNRFAWSAFQSSPDASSLPIPMFGSVKKDEQNGALTPSITAEKEGAMRVAKKEEPQSDVQHGRMQVHVEQEKSGVDVSPSGSYNAASIALIQLLNGSNASTGGDGNVDRDTVNRLPEEKVKDPDRVAESVMESLQSLNISISHDNPTSSSSSGINLAAMASATNATTGENANTMDKSTLPHRMHSSQPVQNQPAHMNFGNPQYATPPASQQYPHQHASMVTIQVQVPENNGYMMVNAPYTGYPIPIQIPPGVRPGMVIPVNVPVMMPHGFPPTQSHMQPPMGSYPPQQSFQGQRYSQPARMQKSAGPKPGTWAAKASANTKGPDSSKK
mmetsp:Transcript_2781/g.4336  ORF Transcript_2781/g.4336 Transcript_2781/m.4336 type:complete len:437 (-) Transcript_2781:98-1408(-)|eukprot:CAMPEP_0196805460 /NCGR_PEP_ID=MMETSP1362-20130617/5230_1 /TAXON_ID=163516 /ORGANISM="Leptocylindrus danicus, Strain CCMP1856" /LENGTH=436 /DNA_ID=CAMNT_0042178399 /DNA_START=87 /DNA_END=1397 /DNA_ORIENTATION=+